MVGMDKFPQSGPALIVVYHGAVPVDFYYFMSKYILKENKLIRCVGDRFLFMIPGVLC